MQVAVATPAVTGPIGATWVNRITVSTSLEQFGGVGGAARLGLRRSRRAREFTTADNAARRGTGRLRIGQCLCRWPLRGRARRVVAGAGAATKLGLGVDARAGASFPARPSNSGPLVSGLSHRARHPVTARWSAALLGSRAPRRLPVAERERLGVEEKLFLGGEVHRVLGADVGAFGDVADGGLAVAAPRQTAPGRPTGSHAACVSFVALADQPAL